MTRVRFAAVFAAAFLLLAPGFVRAAGAPALPAAKAKPSAASRPPAADLKELLATLQNADKRQGLEAQIKALIAIQENATAAKSNADRGVGARILGGLEAGIAWLTATLHLLTRSLRDPSWLWRWLRAALANPAQRALWLQTLFYTAASLLAGFLVRYLMALAIARIRRRRTAPKHQSWARRLRSAAARLSVDLLPILAFAAVAFGIAAGAPLFGPARLALLAIINASALSLFGAALARIALNPLASEQRLVPFDDATAAYLNIWTRRLIAAFVWGYIILQTATLLGLPHAAYAVAARLFGLFVTALLMVFVLQNRQVVADWLRADPEEPHALRILPASLRASLSQTWHLLAMAYLLASYLVWALEIPGGLGYLLRASVETAVIVALLLFVEGRVRRGLDGLFAVDAGVLANYPLVARRVNRYLPALRLTITYALRIGALLAVLGAWQIDVESVALGPIGSIVLGHLAVIAVIAVLAFFVWEVSSGSITAYLERKDESGQAMVRSSRLRTLLPLIRNVLLVTISVLATLVILSELGVNIAPLLAGAGVVGLALGFGAQTLVKDVITGAFILFEGTINVGDVAEINGKAGLVEGLTIRSIRLRDLSGNVHTVNFGSVESITNMTRDFSYYLLDVGIAYRENTDEVVALLREIDEELRQDAVYGPKIIAPLEILGVDRFADSAVYIRARTKTQPIQQWSVGREFNRRMKLKFDECGIEIPFPHRTLYFGEDKHGSAPPMRLALREAEVTAAPAAAALAAGDPPENRG